MNKIKLSKIILIIAIYSVAFTLLFMSIKSYQTYLNTYKNCKQRKKLEARKLGGLLTPELL